MPPSRNPRRVALFAGVNQYKDPTIHELKGAVEDARTLRDFFDAHPGQFDETRLLENPTNDEILDSLDDLTKGLDAGDFLLFFFAGHGVNEGSSQKLLCRDTRRRGGVLNNAFDLKNVDQPQPWHVAAVLDACRTELSVTRGDGVRCGDMRDLDYYDAVISGRRTAGAGSGSISILCSCDKGMTAGEFQMPGEATTHGLFTMAMLNVLRRADESHRGWNFGQDLGQAIAVEMKTLAARSGTGDAEQRPWIEASGDAPLFFKPSLDLEPLRDWVYWFRKDGGITPDEETKCLGVLAGASDAPSAKGIFETIRFFSEWSEGGGNGEFPRAYVSTVLRALCSERSFPETVSVAERGPVPESSSDSLPETSSRALSSGERRRLAEAVQGMVPSWRNRSGLAPLLEALPGLRTEREALATLHKVADRIRDEFLGENDGVGVESHLRRLEPLFRPAAMSGLRRDLQALDSPTAVDGALLLLFRLAGTFCVPRR